MMKKRGYITISIVGLILITLYLGYRLQSKSSDIQTIPIHNISMSFIQSGTTTKLFSQSHDCNFVVNGSYFGKNEEADFYPAGIWFENGQNRFSRENHPYDPNLTQTISIQQQSNIINFYFDQTGINTGDTNTIIFNAGPKLLQGRETNNQILNQPISHRQQEVPRTIMAKDQNNKNYIIIFKKGITLYNVAGRLSANHFVDAINLDGGPSTSITDKFNNKNTFNDTEKLPILFCIK